MELHPVHGQQVDVVQASKFLSIIIFFYFQNLLVFFQIFRVLETLVLGWVHVFLFILQKDLILLNKVLLTRLQENFNFLFIQKLVAIHIKKDKDYFILGLEVGVKAQRDGRAEFLKIDPPRTINIEEFKRSNPNFLLHIYIKKTLGKDSSCGNNLIKPL